MPLLISHLMIPALGALTDLTFLAQDWFDIPDVCVYYITFFRKLINAILDNYNSTNLRLSVLSVCFYIFYYFAIITHLEKHR